MLRSPPNVYTLLLPLTRATAVSCLNMALCGVKDQALGVNVWNYPLGSPRFGCSSIVFDHLY